MNPVHFLFGCRRISCDAAHAGALLDVCLQRSVVYSDFHEDHEGGISFCVSLREAKGLRGLCAERGIPLVIAPHAEGLPHFAWRMRKRFGILIGLMLSLILVLLSERFVWDVRVKGMQTMTEAEVIDELRECGFGVGSYIPSFSASQLENRVLIASDRIAWIAIQMDGTVARVQILEHVEADPEEDQIRPANLVAAADGQIEYLQLYRGNSVVTVGQAVRKGELLVSGLYDNALTGYRYTRAAGQVMARTEHVYRIEIPLSYEEKQYDEERCFRITLNFFEKELKILKNSRNDNTMCDIIKKDKGLELFGVSSLPIFLALEYECPYRYETVTRTHEEALQVAYAELSESLFGLAENAQLLQKNVSTEMTDSSVILTCTVLCIENIALQQDFEIQEAS